MPDQPAAPEVDPERVYELVDAEGNVAYRKGEHLDKALGMGMRLRTAEDEAVAAKAQSEEEFFTSPAQAGLAVAEAGVSGVTLGLSSLARRATDTDAEFGEARKRREHNPGKVAAAEIGAAVLGAGALSMGAKAAGEGASLATRVGQAAATEAKIGGVLGAGQGVQKVALQDKPIDLERAVQTIASSVLENAALGGLTGGTLKLAGAGAKAARKTIGSAAEKLSKARAVGDIPAELATKEGIEAASAKVVDDLAAHHESLKGFNWEVIGKSEGLKLGNDGVRKKLLTPTNLAKNPERALEALEMQKAALKKGLESADETMAKLAVEDRGMAEALSGQLASLADDATTVAIKGKAAQRYSTNVLGKPRKANAKPLDIPIDEAAKLVKALEAGEMQGTRAKAIADLPKLIDSVSTLETRIAQLTDAKGALGKAPAQSFAGKILDKATMGAALALVPGGGVVGGVLTMIASDLAAPIAKRLAGAVSEASLRSSASLDRFVGAASKAGAVAGRASIPFATATLRGLSYGDGKAAEPAKAKGENEMARQYKRVAAEISQQVESGPDGKPQMSMAARQKHAAKMAPLAAVNPQLADMAETFIAKKHAFLASKMPKRPGHDVMPIGLDRWQPSNLEIRRFARYAAAAESAQEIEERLADGVISPEDAETYQVLFPEHLDNLRLGIMQRLPELKASLSFNKKLSLAMLTGAPLVPALHPQILGVIQAQHMAEEGSGGGTQAPRAQPQSGSVRSDVVGSASETPAQARANPLGA